jgi:hypothetical protein
VIFDRVVAANLPNPLRGRSNSASSQWRAMTLTSPRFTGFHPTLLDSAWATYQFSRDGRAHRPGAHSYSAGKCNAWFRKCSWLRRTV